MANPQELLARRVQDGLAAAFGEAYRDTDPLIRPSQHADFQANVAMSLGRQLRQPPREGAAQLVDALNVADICLAPEVSGPGFINLTLRDDWIAAQADTMRADERLGVEAAADPQTVVVEYSSPNIAKEMHVGHLRTTIVGDAIARVLDFAGHHVIRDNHVGDWGTPFGMLIEHLLDVGEDSPEAGTLRSDPNVFYQAARSKFDSDPIFADRSRQRVVLLQGGDPATLRLWQELIELFKDYLHRIYSTLRVTLTDDDIRGESFYNTMLPGVVSDLEAAGLAVLDDGALCVFPPGFTGRDGSPLPVIVRKSDGGYNYSSTDLATIRYRVDDLDVDRVIYVVGSAQALHFRMVFAVARQAGWIPDGTSFEHAQIGNVLGTAGKILRTRGEDRRGGRDRSGEVRRPVHRPGQRVRLRLGPDDLVQGEHRPLPAVRGGPDPIDFPPGRARPRRRCGPDRDRGEGRARPGPEAARLRAGRLGRGRQCGAAPAVQLPVRAGQ